MRRYLVIIGLLFVNLAGVAQSNETGSDLNYIVPKLLPPSPEAATITKGGTFNVGLFTGTAQFSIPLYTLQYRNVSIPIGLSYSSNGVKVNDHASRVGMDWALNAGGVISRVIMDEDDDLWPLSNPPANLHDTTLAKYVYNMYATQQEFLLNSEPDEYSYNFSGESGKFYYDSNWTLHKIALNPLKIERNPMYNDSLWNFKITDGNGVVYVFGGEGAREKTISYNIGAHDWYNAPHYTSWYLRQVIFPVADTVKFYYDSLTVTKTNNVSQSADIGNYTCGDAGLAQYTAGGAYITTVYTQVRTIGVVLNKIVGSDGTVIRFYKSGRPDHGVDKKIDSVTVRNSDSLLIKKYKLGYLYAGTSGYTNDYFHSPAIPFENSRLFLTGITEYSRTGDSLKHIIEYNDPEGLPDVLSLAQDHLGYFNGKQNQSLLPLLPEAGSAYSICTQYESEAILTDLQNFGANREPDFSYAIKGSLKKITYPTGGSTNIEWEPNSVYKNVPVYPAASSYTVTKTGTGLKNPATATGATFAISYNQQVHVSSIAYWSGTGSNTSQNFATIQLKNVTTDVVEYSQVLLEDETDVENIPVEAGNSYQLIVTSRGASLTGEATVTYHSGSVNWVDSSIVHPGMRVKKIVDADSVGHTYEKRYFYCQGPDHLDRTSGVPLPVNYLKDHYTSMTCVAYHDPTGQNPDVFATTKVSQPQVCSGGLYSSYLANNPNILYGTVIEADDSLFSNGCTVHYYKSSMDAPGVSIRVSIPMDLPFTNAGYASGMEDSTKIYQKKNGALSLLKETKNFYSFDTAQGIVLPWYVVNMTYKLSPYSSAYNWANPVILDQFDFGEYDRITHWLKLDSTISIGYDDLGNSLKNVAYMQYNNAGNYQPTLLSTRSSKNEMLTKELRYPSDFAGTDTLYAGMVSKNIILPVIEEEHERAGNFLFLKRNEMQWANNTYLPQSLKLQTTGNSLETRISFNGYDDRGSIIEQQKANDVKYSYIWDYAKAYPVAQSVNASASEIAYTSFESDGKGNWSYSGSTTIHSSAPTGKKGYSLAGGDIIKSGLTTATAYVVTYWKRDSSSTVTVNSASGTLVTTVNGWKLYSHEVTGTSSVTVSGTAYIDELRLYPKDASMTTHTYSPLIGITSQCDANNRITYYEYDGFGRLKLIKDEEGKILKRMDYKYLASYQQ